MVSSGGEMVAQGGRTCCFIPLARRREAWPTGVREEDLRVPSPGSWLPQEVGRRAGHPSV